MLSFKSACVCLCVSLCASVCVHLVKEKYGSPNQMWHFCSVFSQLDSLQCNLTFQQVPNFEELRQKYALGDSTLTSKGPKIDNNLNALLLIAYFHVCKSFPNGGCSSICLFICEKLKLASCEGRGSMAPILLPTLQSHDAEPKTN